MEDRWTQPAQNSIDAIAHGMTYSDGSEFDVRLTVDGELVLHHNAKIELEGPKEGLFPYVEQNHSDDLRAAGFDIFSELIEDPRVKSYWIDGCSTACIEIKRPHPRAKIAGSYFRRGGMTTHISKIMKNIENQLAPLSIPDRNTVIISFDPKTMNAHKLSKITLPVSPISPSIRPWGPAPIRRAMALPSYGRRTVAGIVKHWQGIGAPVLPLAFKHLHSWSKFLHLGRTYSFKGKSLVKLNQIRRGFPIHVWPAPMKIEKDIIAGGFTAVSDVMDPTILRTPKGQTRWLKPGTQPLNYDLEEKMNVFSNEQNAKILHELASERPAWVDLDLKERQKIIDRLGKKLAWSEIKADEGSPPWEVPRFIGHRGAGKTFREG